MRREWAPGSTLLLTTDGVQGNLPQPIFERLAGDYAPAGPERLCRELVWAAEVRGRAGEGRAGPDDITCVAAWVGT